MPENSQNTFFKQYKFSKVLNFIQNKLAPYYTIIGRWKQFVQVI